MTLAMILLVQEVAEVLEFGSFGGDNKPPDVMAPPPQDPLFYGLFVTQAALSTLSPSIVWPHVQGGLNTGDVHHIKT